MMTDLRRAFASTSAGSRRGLLAVSIALLPISPAAAQNAQERRDEERPAQLVAVRDHLESLGYDASFDRDGDVAAEHEEHWNSYVKQYRGGLLMLALIDVAATEDRMDACHRWANALNAEARLARFYFNERRSLALEAWLGGEYDKSAFGTFVEAWQDDGTLVGLSHEAAEGCRGD